MRKLKQFFTFDWLFRAYYWIIGYCKHEWKIYQLRRKYARKPKQTRGWVRALIILFFASLSLLILAIPSDPLKAIPFLGEPLFQILDASPSAQGRYLFSLKQLFITAPVLYILWVLRDQNRLREIADKRKDTNLKEFQQLQLWATGNIEGQHDEAAKQTLQISALHSLRAYLRGDYGEDFRRPAFEIFKASLKKEHDKLFVQLGDLDLKLSKDNILNLLNRLPIAAQLNQIIAEDWYIFLVDNDFPKTRMSLLGVNLGHAYLHHRTFGKKLNLSYSELSTAYLGYSNMRGINLRGARLFGTDFEFSDLRKADLSFVKMQKAILDHAQMDEIDLEFAILSNSSLKYSKLRMAELLYTNMDGVDLYKSQLHGSKLYHASLDLANLSEAIFQQTYLSEARLNGAYLRNAIFIGADMESATLQGAMMINAQLQGAYLMGTNLEAVDLSGANLSGVISKADDKSTKSILDRVGIDSDLSGLPSSISTISERNKLISELREKYVFDEFDPARLDEVINRIEIAQSPYNLRDAILGAYTLGDASGWAVEYENATKSK